MKPTEEQLRDEEILASIIAGGEASGRVVQPHNGRNGVPGSGNYFGVYDNGLTDLNGPCCAVGSGILFAGIGRCLTPLDTFSRIHDVSIDYATGVSVGFEGQPYYLSTNSDYNRGIAVGQAVFDYFYPGAQS